MKQITAKEFQALINENPSWCRDLNEPIEITTYCDMYASNITHLSPLLTFSGRNNWGEAANFVGCENLKIATGNYPGYVDFSYSGVEDIRDVVVLAPNKYGYTTYFYGCKNLIEIQKSI